MDTVQARALFNSQRTCYWRLAKIAEKLRQQLAIASTSSYPPQPQSQHYLQRASKLFKQYRALTVEFRNYSYQLRAAGQPEYKRPYEYGSPHDSTEVFTNWGLCYGGPEYQFAPLSCEGQSLKPGEGKKYQGFWQLLHNLQENSPRRSSLLQLWPHYFGYTSSNTKTLKTQQEILQELSFPLSGSSLEGAIAVDIETSSKSPLTGELLELGLVEIKGPDPQQWPRVTLRFRLSSPLAAQLGTGPEHLHGITPAALEDQPSIEDPAIQKLLRSYLCSGRRLLCHNSSFEFRWLSHYLPGFFEANQLNTGLQTVIDTAVLSKFIFTLNSPGSLKSNSLQAIIEAVGYPYVHAHRAQADAMMAAIAAYKSLESFNQHKLAELSQEQYLSLLRSCTELEVDGLITVSSSS